MKSGYHVRPLAFEDALSAYSLIQMAVPSFPGEDWGQVIASGVRWTLIAVKDPGGYVRGLAAYRIETHPAAGELMDVPFFVVASVMNDDAIASILFTSLRRRSAGCKHIRFWSKFPSNFVEMESEERFRLWDHGLMFRLDQKPAPALL